MAFNIRYGNMEIEGMEHRKIPVDFKIINKDPIQIQVYTKSNIDFKLENYKIEKKVIGIEECQYFVVSEPDDDYCNVALAYFELICEKIKSIVGTGDITERIKKYNESKEALKLYQKLYIISQTIEEIDDFELRYRVDKVVHGEKYYINFETGNYVDFSLSEVKFDSPEFIKTVAEFRKKNMHSINMHPMKVVSLIEKINIESDIDNFLKYDGKMFPALYTAFMNKCFQFGQDGRTSMFNKLKSIIVRLQSRNYL